MTDFIRVRDKQTRHQYSIPASRFDAEIWDQLDQPATNGDGTLVPPKHHVAKGSRPSAASKPAAKRTTKTTATAAETRPTSAATEKEND